VDGLLRPVVVIGKTEKGVDYDARDGRPSKLIVMILTPDAKSQQDLLADAGQLFSQKEIVDRTLAAKNFVELVAVLNAPVK
jgi:mannitol/fructose-specific phosphotransferase system IIA component (Ntr-type)